MTSLPLVQIGWRIRDCGECALTYYSTSIWLKLRFALRYSSARTNMPKIMRFLPLATINPLLRSFSFHSLSLSFIPPDEKLFQSCISKFRFLVRSHALIRSSSLDFRKQGLWYCSPCKHAHEHLCLLACYESAPSYHSISSHAFPSLFLLFSRTSAGSS